MAGGPCLWGVFGSSTCPAGIGLPSQSNPLDTTTFPPGASPPRTSWKSPEKQDRAFLPQEDCLAEQDGLPEGVAELNWPHPPCTVSLWVAPICPPALGWASPNRGDREPGTTGDLPSARPLPSARGAVPPVGSSRGLSLGRAALAALAPYARAVSADGI